MSARNKYGLAAILIGSCAIFCGNDALHAQVTLGSNGLPARAALLDLKTQDVINPPDANNILNVSSLTGGLLLPRVKLVNQATLEPFINASDPDWQNNSSTKLKEKHAGMMVYNISNNPPFRIGTYTWNGRVWMASHRPELRPGHGLFLDSKDIQLDEQLNKPITFDTDVHQLSVNGTNAMNVTLPVKLTNEWRYTNNSPKKTQVLVSDADGNAIWEDNKTVPIVAPIATLDGAGTSINVKSSNANLRNTKATIKLPKGRWVVMVTMLAGVVNGTENGRFWLETSFYKEDSYTFDESIFVGNNKLISGHLYDRYNIISGYVIIENKEDRVVSYTYKAKKVIVLEPATNSNSSTNVYVNGFGSADSWSENAIVAFALVP